MSNLFAFPRQRSIAGAKLYFRQTGTSTPQNVYTDIDLAAAHENPVVADADGYFDPIYLDPSLPDYRVIHTDGSNVDDDPTLEVELEPTIDDVPSSSNQAQAYRVKGTAPAIVLEETDQATDSKKWRIRANGALLTIETMNDAESSSVVLLTMNRTDIIQLTPLRATDTTLNVSTLAVGHSAIIYATANTAARSNNDTPSADPVFQFTNAPAGTYLTEGVIKYTADTSGDFHIDWPRAGAQSTGSMTVVTENGGGSAGEVHPFSSAVTSDLGGVPSGFHTSITVYGVETATAGQTLGPYWSQGTSDAAATTVRAGSWLKVTRLT